MSVTRRTALKAALVASPLVPSLVTPGGAAAATPRRRPALHLVGDSTAARKSPTAAPETGWGMALPFFLHPHLAVVNHAVNGRSSKSFLDEGRLAAVLPLLRPGDLLLVQFGHNDSKAADPTRYTEPWTTYRHYLRQYLDGARTRGARPVLLTSVERRKFDAAGNAVPTHGDYPAAVRALAAEAPVPLVDVQATSLTRWQAVGAEPLKSYFNWLEPGEHPNYPDGAKDNTHFRPRGAIEVARMVATGLRDSGALHPRHLRRLNGPVPDEWITWPAP
ncbi:rhamnogalacturonan acetylesterase [Streptomyces sp. NPDC051561]|uniref:rhamnogalacturonan acetylesterase n=1 Tax=Streptomyces sp. NPDC051561 TaxID=3365658 RepID=UPI0037ADCBD2